MRLARYLIALAVVALIAPSTSQAFQLGVGDGAQYPAAPSAQLNAKTYRVVIDPARDLEDYAQRIADHRAVGQEPQLVIGGTGTKNHESTRGIVEAAVAAAKRWPYAYSISVVNEPNEAGMGVCEYARVWVKAHKALTNMGVKRVLFGEWSPDKALEWHRAALTRCKNTSPTLRATVKRIAFHGYWTSINWGPLFRSIHRDVHAKSPLIHVTEAGAVLNSIGGGRIASARDADLAGLKYWRMALRAAKRDKLAQIVAWSVHDESGNWSSGLIDKTGRVRPAFHLIANR